MKLRTFLIPALFVVFAAARVACAQGTAFTYQGSLISNGSAANGVYDLQFALFNAAPSGTQVGAAITNGAVAVSNGVFTTTLDFGAGVFTGPSYWLGIGVRTSGNGAFAALAPRQRLTPTPYAIFAETAGSVSSNSVTSAQLETTGSPANGQVLAFNGSSLVWTNPAAGAASGWSLTGNAGTTGVDVLGTTDNQPLQLVVNNAPALRLNPGAGNTVNLTVGPFAGAAIGGQGINVFGGQAGNYNTVYPNFSTILGGFNNVINPGAPESVIGGGQGNVISGGTSAIGGGFFNSINGQGGVIPGGFNNVVSGNYSFAAGNAAQAINNGAFVWADNSGGAFQSSADNQFSVRASGGVRFVTGGAGVTIDGQPFGTGGGGGSGWSLTGNSGTIPGTDFLGTTDYQPLELWVNGGRALRLEPTSASPNVIGGDPSNAVTPGISGSTIGGGVANTIINTTQPGNNYVTIAGGAGNTAGGLSATVGGGGANSATNEYATVSGGTGNIASQYGATVPGGIYNTASGYYSFAAGLNAVAANTGAFVWADASGGAFSSTAGNQFSVRAMGGVRFVTGGAGVTVDGQPIGSGGGGGGNGWSLTGNGGTIPGTDFLGTTDNEPLELWVNGGRALRLEPTASALPNVIGGAPNNAVNQGAAGATIGGGSGNTASGQFATVGGGNGNLAGGPGTFVGGGGYDGSTSPGGNTALYTASTVVGGVGNSAVAYYATVVGGYSNNASGSEAFVGGGGDNTAGGFAATVPGGLGNLASGGYSFAAGDGAKAVHDGAFVWADFSSGTGFSSTANNQFSVRANGGVRFVTGGAGMTIDGVPVGAGSGGGGGASTNGWNLTGNAGTTPGVNFLGTTDPAGFELHVNGERGLRLDYVSEQVVPESLDYNYGVNVNGGYWGNTISNGVVGGTIAGGGEESRVNFSFSDYPNIVTGDFGTIGGGNGNVAGDYSTISGGYDNFAGNYSTIPGGYNNYAVGKGSFALGRSASVSYDGSFVWGDGSTVLYADGPNEFDVLATGGAAFHTGGSSGVWMTSGGKVGINTSSPTAALDVNGEFIVVEGSSGLRCYLGDDGSGNDVQVGSLKSGVTAVSMYNETDNAYMHLYCSSITIEGGANLAEPFQISTTKVEVPLGAVVVIDEENPGHLKLSDRPYDTRVAGVVSGANGINPGIQMQQQGLMEGGKNVALTGRVYVQADASNGPIKPGDLLTSSASPGHAMKVTDHAKAQGAILGKAMTGLKEGSGMVLVLVTLQ